MTTHINLQTEHCPQGAAPFLNDYWLAWANGVQGDGETENAAVENARARLAAAEAVGHRYSEGSHG